MNVINFPNCPYCGERMRYSSNITHAWFECESCQSTSPKAIRPDFKSSGSPIGDWENHLNESRKLAADAAARRPVQRPLTLEEMLGSRVVWLEDVDKAEVIPAIVDSWDDEGVRYVLDRDRRMYVRRSDYQRRWRAWGKKPTDEERSAAEWM